MLVIIITQLFERQPHKIVKHTQKICRQTADELFECVCYFVGLALKELNFSCLSILKSSVLMLCFLTTKNFKLVQLLLLIFRSNFLNKCDTKLVSYIQ